MKQALIFILLILGLTVHAQKGTVRGTILDGSNADAIIGGSIVVNELGTGTITDLDGKFELKLDPGTYSLTVSYIGFENITISDVEVKASDVLILADVLLGEGTLEIEEVVVKAKAIKTTETALLTVKKSSAVMLDGISAAKMALIGDGNAVDAAKRVTGVSVEGGKYVYVRGLGDRYIKTTLNGVDIPGLDPDKNTLQMDIFPTNLINNIIVSKNFTADMPADFTGGLVNVEMKDFPEDKVFSVSLGVGYNPAMHLNSNYLGYDGSSTDFLGFDNGQRALPTASDKFNIPTPISGASDQEVTSFVKSFDSQLQAQRQTSLMDLSGSVSYANQISLGKNDNSINSPKLGYLFSLSYKSDYKYFDDVTYGEYQRNREADNFEMRYATEQTGEFGQRGILIGGMGGVAYKTRNNKIRLMLMHLQNGESRAGKFDIINDGEAVGQSGYFATSDNLEYNQRALSNLLLNGTHVMPEKDWEIDWRISPTISRSSDPDIRKTAFTITPVDTFFSAGAGGNPSRIWRSLSEVNLTAKVDVTKKYNFGDTGGKLKFGVSQNYKDRDYEILFYDIQFFGNQSWNSNDPSQVLTDKNIFPAAQNNIYYQSGNSDPNPNQYSSNVQNTGFYVSNETTFKGNLKTIVGLRAENYVQRHTGRDQKYAGGDFENGKNFDNEIVLNDFNLFPTANLVYSITDNQNIRVGYARTIARPSFKELSFAQIIDPITNRIFNGSLFEYEQWGGVLVPTNVNNYDLRWEMFLEDGGLLSVSPFYKTFANPIELVRIPEQQASTEYQPRNVGDGSVIGAEIEVRKSLIFMSDALANFDFNGNLTIVQSTIDMTDIEFNARKNFEKEGQTVSNQRAMAGQSPYVINAGLSYNSFSNGINAGIFYNVKGPTLFIVGGGLFPDIYTQPFHSLNFSFNKKLGKDQKTSIDFQVSNILNSKIQELYQAYNAEPQPFTIMSPGTAFSIGASYKI